MACRPDPLHVVRSLCGMYNPLQVGLRLAARKDLGADHWENVSSATILNSKIVTDEVSASDNLEVIFGCKLNDAGWV
jgi:hypothetical protein